mmetsp:Transcript_25152/g.32682  ORF Transcript_25152/g.32682 Transcript_25152/m.32682 type:complete len:932 (-) Transcript_25152:127-2922(-)
MGQKSIEFGSNEGRRHSISIDGHRSDGLTKLKYTTFVVRHPFLVQFLAMFVIVICGAIIGATGSFEITEASENDYLISSDIRTIRKFAVDAAYEAIGEDESAGGGISPRTLTDDNLNLFILYSDRSDDENMLETEKIAAMESTEQVVLDNERYEEFCLSDFEGSCSAASYLSAVPLGLEDTASLEYLADPDTLSAFSSLYFSPEFSASNLEAKNMRALFQFGFPLEGVDEDDQDAEFQDYIWGIHKDLEKQAKEVQNADAKVYWFNGELFDMLFLEVVYGDFAFAVGSMLFVFLYMAWHTKSLYLALLGIFQVVASFVPGFFIYRLIFQVNYFQTLHMLAIFVILGVGADNVFVFTDAWNQMKAYPQLEADDELRLAMTFRRAARMTLATSFTTFSAFMATGISKIMPIATFAYFASCVIMCDFILVLTFYTPALVIKKRYLDKCCGPGCCCCCCQKKSAEISEEKELPSDEFTTGTEISPSENVGGSLSTGSSSSTAKKRSVEEIFEKQYAPFIYKFRYPILVFFVAVYVMMVSLTSQLQPQSDEVQWLPDNHFITKTLDLLSSGYQVSEYSDQVTVDLVWGVSGIDRSGTDPFQPEDIGTVIWDDNFTLLPEENQQHLLSVCSAAEEAGLLAEIDNNKECFMQDYRSYRLAMNQSWPAVYSTEAELAADLQAFMIAYEKAEYLQFDTDNDLKFAKLTFTIPLAWGQPHSQTYPWYKKWEDFVTDVNSYAPDGVDNAFQSASNGGWCWMITEVSLVENLYQGMALAMTMAFITLVFATQNIILALFAAISITGIVFCVLGCAYLLGWQLGIAESVSGVILVGFSVDYVVHISELYAKIGKEGSRLYKATQALRSMGVTILAGAITTFGSGLFLFFCTLTFFYKFAVMICLTITFSFAWSLGFLSTILMVLGPEKDFGSVKVMVNRIRGRK